MSRLALTDVIVELHVPDFETVKDFYGKLGFEKVWEYPPKGNSDYLVMKRQMSILAFYCGNEEVYNHPHFKKFPKTTVRGYGVEISIHVIDQPLELYYNQVVEKIGKEAVVQPIETKAWGNQDFRIIDPFGYYLCIRDEEDMLTP